MLRIENNETKEQRQKLIDEFADICFQQILTKDEFKQRLQIFVDHYMYNPFYPGRNI